MEEKKIRIRKEVVCCDICKRPREFFYLLDFVYGQKLVYFDGCTELAFINLFEDEIFLEYEKEVKNILNEKGIIYSPEEITNYINKSFGITCDMVKGMNIDFSVGQKKCLYCGSINFERNMVEPESMIEVVVPVVSHEQWKMLTENQKQESILNQLRKEGII